MFKAPNGVLAQVGPTIVPNLTMWYGQANIAGEQRVPLSIGWEDPRVNNLILHRTLANVLKLNVLRKSAIKHNFVENDLFRRDGDLWDELIFVAVEPSGHFPVHFLVRRLVHLFHRRQQHPRNGLKGENLYFCENWFIYLVVAACNLRMRLIRERLYPAEFFALP